MGTASTSTGHDGRPIRLLVVDDDDGIRTLIEVTVSLDPRFVLVGAAPNACKAIAMLDDDLAPDLVLLDVSLPDRDGIELVSEVRQRAPEAKIALFTGWSDESTLARAEAAGADATFGKDGDPRGLLDALAELGSIAR